MNNETTATANHPNFSLSEDFENIDIMTCRSIQRFCGAHHTPGLHTLVANLVVVQIDARDALVDFKCLGQGLEAGTDQGWHVVQGFYRQNLITEIPRTIHIQLRDIESL